MGPYWKKLGRHFRPEARGQIIYRESQGRTYKNDVLCVFKKIKTSERLEAVEARRDLPFSRAVPKSLGAVSITLWSPFRGGHPLHQRRYSMAEGSGICRSVPVCSKLKTSGFPERHGRN